MEQLIKQHKKLHLQKVKKAKDIHNKNIKKTKQRLEYHASDVMMSIPKGMAIGGAGALIIAPPLFPLGIFGGMVAGAVYPDIKQRIKKYRTRKKR